MSLHTDGREYAQFVHPLIKNWSPKSELGKEIFRILPYLPVEEQLRLKEKIASAGVLESKLSLKVFRNYAAFMAGLIPAEELILEDYGVVGDKVVTTVGVGFIVDAFQNSVEVENMKFHGLGTGSTAEAVGDTALVTELTTEYTGNVRATGSTTEGAGANIYRTVGTNTLDGTPGAALREHGIFSASSAGVLLDRTVYSAITLSSGDGLESTYDLTLTAGG